MTSTTILGGDSPSHSGKASPFKGCLFCRPVMQAALCWPKGKLRLPGNVCETWGPGPGKVQSWAL